MSNWSLNEKDSKLKCNVGIFHLRKIYCHRLVSTSAWSLISIIDWSILLIHVLKPENVKSELFGTVEVKYSKWQNIIVKRHSIYCFGFKNDKIIKTLNKGINQTINNAAGIGWIAGAEDNKNISYHMIHSSGASFNGYLSIRGYHLTLLVRGIFMCFEIICIVHILSHSISTMSFEIIGIVHCATEMAWNMFHTYDNDTHKNLSQKKRLLFYVTPVLLS